jgi:choice-of-anchor B domain-containing protein
LSKIFGMKRLPVLLLLLFAVHTAFAQTPVSLNMTKLGTWRDADTVYYNDIWGYAANGYEYAIIGSNTSTNFVDVTNPKAPRLVASIAGKQRNTIWRDFKTYKHYAYGVADGSSGHSLQIFDLQYLPDSVHKVFDDNSLSMSAHTLFIDSGKLYLVSNLRNSVNQALDVFSLANPVQPTYSGTLKGTFFTDMHAIFVKNDTAYCSTGWPGMAIYNVADINNPVLISSITSYPGQGYNHSSWLSADSKKMIMTDEVPGGMPVKLFDMTNPADPVYKSSFFSNAAATPHNTFIVGNNYAVLSYYHDGVQVFDISNSDHVSRLGFYDTYPDNPTDYTGYHGCWGVYPFLPSGNIIASDITYGLYVMSPPYPVDAKPPVFTVFPNPSAGMLSISLEKPVKNLELTVYDNLGRQMKHLKGIDLTASKMNLEDLRPGLYFIRATGEGYSETQRFLIRK